MKNAFLLLGVMTIVVIWGAFIAFNEKVEAPEVIHNTKESSMTLTSSAFTEGGLIPSKYTCDGENISPEIRIDNIPEGTKSLVLVMDDPDIPESVKQARGIEKFDHWVVYNIPPTVTVIPEGVIAGNEGLNSTGEVGYRGACPPDREHRYFFRLYALPNVLNFLKVPALYDVEEAAKGSMIESATLMGRYERIPTSE